MGFSRASFGPLLLQSRKPSTTNSFVQWLSKGQEPRIWVQNFSREEGIEANDKLHFFPQHFDELISIIRNHPKQIFWIHKKICFETVENVKSWQKKSPTTNTCWVETWKKFPQKFFLQKFEKCSDKNREFVIQYFLILFEIENLQNFTQREK